MSDTSGVSVSGSVAVMAALHAALDALRALPLDRVSDDEMLELWRELDRFRNRVPAAEFPVIAQVDRRNLPHTHGARSVATLARDLLRIVSG